MKTNRALGVMFAMAMLVVVAITCRAAFLDGTHGKVKMVPDKAAADKGEKGFNDTLSFANGRFSSAAFLAKGFKSAVYHGEAEENEAEFEVEQIGKNTNSLVNWLGEIRGKKLLGRLTWKKADGTTLSYDFDGTKE
jgi:hypothetical protein